jgi:hypothetical protein
MTAVLQVSKKHDKPLSRDQLLHQLISQAARELGLSRKQSEDAAAVRSLRVDGVKMTISCLETDVQKDAIIVAKLAVPIDFGSMRQLLEINLIAAVALNSTIAIDCEGAAILLALMPIVTSKPAVVANQISQMAVFANTLEFQIANKKS